MLYVETDFKLINEEVLKKFPELTKTVKKMKFVKSDKCNFIATNGKKCFIMK